MFNKYGEDAVGKKSTLITRQFDGKDQTWAEIFLSYDEIEDETDSIVQWGQ